MECCSTLRAFDDAGDGSMTSVTEPTTAVVAASPPHFGLTKFLDPLRIPPVIRPHARWHQDDITVTMTRTWLRLHSQLPPTEVWAYQGQFPGPTIEVRRDKQLRVSWTNAIEGTMPLVAVQAPLPPPGSDPAANPVAVPGYRNPDGSPRPNHTIIEGVADLPAWTVVHLHGARTGGGNDGWAHNAVLKPYSQLAEYPNQQQSTTLWYHDHAMAVTRFNVHAGLVGLYLIRDEEEDDLDLPDGDHEIPLILTDRNLDTDPATGALTGQLLFKVPVTPAGVQLPFTGPFNLVNGVIWPYLDVDRRWYRFRVLNASNSRFYQLDLVDESGARVNQAVRIIGTDGGLLPAPAEVPATGLVLSPSERVDILVDFRSFAGQRLRLTNPRATPGTEPDLLELRVAERPRNDPFRLPQRLSKSYVRLEHGSTVPEDHHHAWVALVPPSSAGEAHPQMWELEEIDGIPGGATPPVRGIVQVQDPVTGAVRTFRMVARLFDETTTIFFDHGRYAAWNLLHVGGPAHPMHVHLAQLQLLTRRALPFDTPTGGTTAPLQVDPQAPVRPIERYEEGWKDTFQVQAGEWVTVAGEFAGATGEFMYHCHILDHEDTGMMRQFVVHPPEVARFHQHPGGHPGHSAHH
jgi:FtsP/CotA-like multicopper oxidase with cupredoxin domain